MKKNRHKKIIEIVSSNRVETQEELAGLLKKEGYDVTQATISRDIRSLNLSKKTGADGVSRYFAPSSSEEDYTRRYEQVMAHGITSMDVAENILVIKTVSGMAMAVAAAIDDMEYPEVVGCIAGDDTIMCVIRTRAQAVDVMDRLTKWLVLEG